MSGQDGGMRNDSVPRAKVSDPLALSRSQFVDALAPSNFIATNPEVLQATIETGGENLLKGLNRTS
jgi:polyhydroxyalkanoate synthase subunit PhaC